MLKYSLKLFYRTPQLNILISFIVVIMIFIINLVFGVVVSERKEVSVLDCVMSENMFYFQPNLSTNLSISDIIYKREQIKNNMLKVNGNDIQEIYEIERYQVFSERFTKYNNDTEVIALPNDLLRSLDELNNIDLKFDSKDMDDGIINIYITNHYNNLKVGEIFSGFDATYSNNVKFRVIGIIDRPIKIWRFTASGNYLSSNRLFKEIHNEYDGIPYIICGQSELLHSKGFLFVPDNNMIVSFKNDITSHDISVKVNELKDMGFVTGKNEFIARSKDNMAALLIYYTPLILFLIVITVVGVVVILLLNNQLSNRIYSVLALCGCTKHKLLIINLLYALILAFVSIIILFSMFGIVGATGFLGGFKLVNEYTIYIVIGTLLCLQILSTLILNVTLSTKSIKELIIN